MPGYLGSICQGISVLSARAHAMGEQVLGDVQQAGHEYMRMAAEAMRSTLNWVHGSRWLQHS